MFDADGPIADEILGLWWLLLVLGTVVFVAFCVVLVIALRRGAGDTDRPAPSAGSLRRFVFWGGVGVPAIVLVVVMAFTVDSMRSIPGAASAGALRIEVVGHQWWYEIRYPDHGVVTANELHLPVGRQVELHVSSSDVIHSFWVPGLAGKVDMLPDRTNVLVLEADELGHHRSQCAEFCGLQHARMRLETLVEPVDDFAAWIDANDTPAAEPVGSGAAAGLDVFLATGCASCHTVRGTTAVGADGPDLTHMASRRTIGAVTLDLNRENLRAWIDDPHEFKTGVDMPPAELTDDQMDDLLAYLESLE